MKIGIGQADSPGNQTIRTDVDLFFGHDERAVEQREIADRAPPVLSNRKRAAGIARYVITDHDGTGFFAPELPKNLGALAIKSFTECDICRNRLRPPIVYHESICLD